MSKTATSPQIPGNNAAICAGKVWHVRHKPRIHRFGYPYFMWLLNLNKLAEIPDYRPWFSTRRWALSRLRASDYLPGNPAFPDAASAVKDKMERLTNTPVSGDVYALLNLRTMGIYFSPVNFYWAVDDNGTPSHFLAEVSNTPWNQRHYYGFLLAEASKPSHDKAFHVSPFNPIDQRYEWSISLSEKKIAIVIHVVDEAGKVFDAGVNLTPKPLTRRSAAIQLIKNPAMSIFTVVLIYWQALRLWLKRVPYHPHQSK